MNSPLKIISEKENAKNDPWYAKGLRFKCTECGQCCTGAPGYVWMSDEEIVSIADHLNISTEEFGKRYLRFVNGRYALLEDPKTYDCVFLENKKCRIYAARPMQCRTFPWWKQNLASPEDWQEAATYCEGISCSAPITPFDTIQQELYKNIDPNL